jgi:hypothetical protein
MRRLLEFVAVLLLCLISACSSVSPSHQQLKLVDSFIASLNAGDLGPLYDMHSAEFKNAINRANATKYYEDFRAWAGPCQRIGDGELGWQETASRRSTIVRVSAQCGSSTLLLDFVLGNAKDSERVSAFRWKEGA